MVYSSSSENRECLAAKNPTGRCGSQMKSICYTIDSFFGGSSSNDSLSQEEAQYPVNH